MTDWLDLATLVILGLLPPWPSQSAPPGQSAQSALRVNELNNLSEWFSVTASCEWPTLLPLAIAAAQSALRVFSRAASSESQFYF